MHYSCRLHQTHYEQFGEITGDFIIENREPIPIKIQGVRDHSYGKWCMLFSVHNVVTNHITTLSRSKYGPEALAVWCLPGFHTILHTSNSAYETCIYHKQRLVNKTCIYKANKTSKYAMLSTC